MEENKGLTIAIIGIVAVTAIVGLVFLFSVAKTGAGIYGGAIKGNLFPYTRFTSTQPVVETPGWEETITAPETEVYGGASRLQDNTAVERQVSSGFRYGRELGMIPTTLTTCMALDFRDTAGNRVFAPIGVTRQQLQDYEPIKEHCFRYTADGTPVSTIIAKDACCTVR
ncbi:MAG: hypothetical protein QW666_02675 [Candidatus Woesearchaeota archaeon]